MTSILTEDEINGIADKHEAALGGVWPHEFAEAIIDATIKRLAAGVSVEPVESAPGYELGNLTVVGFTLDQLTTAIAAARVQTIEECAKLCEDLYEASGHDVEYGGCISAANAIRDLMGKEST